MSYGLSPRLFIENGPAVEASKAQQRSSTAAHRLIWRQLRPGDRLALIDGLLKTAA